MDSVLVVCYSLTGVSRQAAQLLASHMGWPLGSVEDVHPRRGAAGYGRCMLDVLLQRQPAIRYSGPAPEDYRTVVLVSPIWMYRLAAPMRSFLAQHRLERVAVVVTMGGSGAVNAFRQVAELSGRPPVLTLALTTREVQTGSGTQRLLDAGESLLSTPRDVPTEPMPL